MSHASFSCMENFSRLFVVFDTINHEMAVLIIVEIVSQVLCSRNRKTYIDLFRGRRKSSKGRENRYYETVDTNSNISKDKLFRREYSRCRDERKQSEEAFARILRHCFCSHVDAILMFDGSRKSGLCSPNMESQDEDTPMLALEY